MKHILVKGTPNDFRIGFFLNPKIDCVEYTKNPKGISLRGFTDASESKELIGALKKDVIRKLHEVSSFSLEVFTVYWFVSLALKVYKTEVFFRSECAYVNQFWHIVGIVTPETEIDDYSGG